MLDQTSYKAELWALFKLVRTIADVRGEIWVIIDNMSVQREAELRRVGGRPHGGKVGNCPGLWNKVEGLILRCPGLRFAWVPSHGKKGEWEAPEGHDSREWRKLNDIADEEASKRGTSGGRARPPCGTDGSGR